MQTPINTPGVNDASLDRRGFFKTVGGGLTAAMMLTPREHALAQAASEKSKLARITSCSWPIRSIFKTRTTRVRSAAPSGATNPTSEQGSQAGRGGGQTRANAGLTNAQMKEKYGEITMMDFPQFTKDTFPGVTQMDIRSSLFGDVTDDSMYVQGMFDPSSAAGRKWLDQFAAKLRETGTRVQHVSNNAPTNLASADAGLRKAGVEIAKKWLDGAAILGVRSMRMNSPQALGPSIRPNAARANDGYPRNADILPLLAAAIESYKEMADHGGKVGIRVTIENHWGLAADPMNIRMIIDEVNHPY